MKLLIIETILFLYQTTLSKHDLEVLWSKLTRNKFIMSGKKLYGKIIFIMNLIKYLPGLLKYLPLNNI